MKSQLYSIDIKDISKALITAFFAGAVTAVYSAFQQAGFDVFSANWHVILSDAFNGGIITLTGYLATKFFSTSDGKVFGRIG